MREPDKILSIVICVYAATVAADYYDVTTVYRFKKQEFDQNGELNTRYLDSCSVTVEPGTNAIGLPYYNLHDEHIIYPVANPIIPLLTLKSNNSEWKTLSSDGEEVELPAPVEIQGNYIELNKFKNTDLFTQDSITLDEINNISSCIEYIAIFSPDTLSALNEKANNVFLSVEFKSHFYTLYFIKGGSGDVANAENYIKISMNTDNKELHICSVTKSFDDEESREWFEDCESLPPLKSGSDFKFTFYISLNGAVLIYNTIDKKVYLTKKTHQTTYDYIVQKKDLCLSEDNSNFKLFEKLQLALHSDNSIISPWRPIQKTFSFFISFYRKSDHSLVSYLVDQNDKDEQKIKRFELKEEAIFKINNSTDVDEKVVAKMWISIPANWTQNKQIQIQSESHVYITDIWEGINSDIYRIHSSQKCGKSDIRDIFNIVLKDPVQNNRVSICSNGGFLDNSNTTCICPPGFTGGYCEISCGRNSFGKQCSKVCSQTDNACKGMILCTPFYGCTCPPGYQGNQCLEQCEEGTYGANCLQKCGQCQSGCDQYTGHCRGGCDSAYMIWPLCKHSHSYWTGVPEIIISSLHTVTIRLEFRANIHKSYDRIKFFMVQYKEDNKTSWNNSSYKIFTEERTEHVVHNLKTGRKYLFRVLLVDETLQTSNPELSKISECVTECIISDRTNDLQITKTSNTSIELIWTENTVIDANECPFSSYILEIDEILTDGFVETRKITGIQGKIFKIKMLKPNETYLVKLKKLTVHGESLTMSSINVTTDAAEDYSKPVKGLTVKHTRGSGIKIEWFQSPFYKMFFIKFILIKQLSCNQDENQSPIQVISTESTNYFLNLEANAQYQIFVTGDERQLTNKENLTVITNGKLPSISPILLTHTFRVTNESGQVQWSHPESWCKYMNGFFEKYFIELLDTHNNILKSFATDHRKLELSDLSPKTHYKLRIRYVNHLGYNPEVYLEHKFTTKATSFLTAQDITAYKTSANMIGLRWKIPNSNSTITGMNVKIQNSGGNISFNITNVELLQCKAWPLYLCYNLTQLKPNTKYAVSINIFTEEFPEGGSASAIQAVTRETVPSTVSDIKVEDISEKNLTISWRIPFQLNGILRKFIIEIEHLSSFDELTCCQSIVTINHLVSEEKELYSQVIENIQMASSYQITIRGLTKRLGQEISKIFVIPPSLIPIKQKPEVKFNDQDVIWEEQMNNTTSIASAENDLITDLLIMVQSSGNITDNVQPSQFRTEMNRLLKSENWWLACVCKPNEECRVNIGNGKESGSLSYGEIRNRALKTEQNYTIVLAQVNKYLSAQSYTVARSTPVSIKAEVITSTTSQTPRQNIAHFPETSFAVLNELGDFLSSDNYSPNDPTLDILHDYEVTVPSWGSHTKEVIQDYEVSEPSLEEDLII